MIYRLVTMSSAHLLFSSLLNNRFVLFSTFFCLNNHRQTTKSSQAETFDVLLLLFFIYFSYFGPHPLVTANQLVSCHITTMIKVNFVS